MDLTIQPEGSFLRYRYATLAAGVVASILGVAWLIPLVPSEYLGTTLLLFWLWVASIGIPALGAAIWYPAHTRSLRYTLQPDRIVAEEGVWFRTRKFVPYSRITDVTVRQGPFERRYGIHRLAIQTAGSPVAEAVLLGVGDPERIRALLLERKSISGDAASGETPVEILSDIRDHLGKIRRALEDRSRP